MLRVEIHDAACHVDIDWELAGSLRRGDVQAKCLGVRTKVSLSSQGSEQDVVKLVKVARQGCFLEQLARQAADLSTSLEVNGRQVDV